jgi:hypothetical protein
MSIERVILAVGGVVGVSQIWRAIRTGSASEGGRIRREDRPILFWTLVAVAAIIVGIFFYFAAFGDFSQQR